MASIEETIEVDVPVGTAYNQWTQFEEFPEFMDGVESVQQIDDTHLLWTAEINGQREEWRAEITEQHPDHRIAWKSIEGRPNAGVVTFHQLDENRTRIALQMDWEPDGALEQAGAAIGSDSRQVKGDLERFKELIESRGVETGAWRGEVENSADRTS
ncbi:MAG TPA: SRPBCC family protein [Gaiellaceae bacterium]|nr:SRPBCC family protein [Gaiellaceae bacterium]